MLLTYLGIKLIQTEISEGGGGVRRVYHNRPRNKKVARLSIKFK